VEEGFRTSLLSLGSHTATHVDAPAHLGGVGVDSLPLSLFVGWCRVIEMRPLKNEILPEHLQGEAILLLKTSGGGSLTLEAARLLARMGFKTLGIDTLTIGDRDVHRFLLERGMGIIEGLNLEGVKPGRYFLAAQPLKIAGCDGSPVRAILIQH